MEKDILLSNCHFADINPRVCGTQDCEPRHTFGPAARDYYLLHYVRSGRGRYENPRGQFGVKAGELFIIRPAEVCVYAADAADPWSYCWIGFTCRAPLDAPLQKDVVAAEHLADYFAELAACGEIHQGRELVACGIIYQILAGLLPAQPPRAQPSSQYVDRAINYIESNYMKDLRVEQIARYLNLDRSYFSNLFKKYTGQNPQQYIVHYRLERALALMKQNLGPGEAASRVGYTDSVNFSRMFKRKYGASPRNYLRSNSL